MSKPFLIVDISGGLLGKIFERPTYEEAVDCAMGLVISQLEIKADSPAAIEIRADIEVNLGYSDDTIEICIGQAEDE